MANWKKVLLSGSDIHVTSISASNVPEGTTSDRVLVRDATTGAFKSVLQTSILGQTSATFTISGSTGQGVASFDAAAGDQLIFTGSNGIAPIVSDNGANTTVTLGLPEGTISSSAQVILTQSAGFTSFSSSFASTLNSNSESIAVLLISASDLDTELQELSATASVLTTNSASIASNIISNNSTITNLESSVASINDFSSSVVNNDDTGSFAISSSIIGTDLEIEVTANGAQGIQIGLPDNIKIDGTLEADNIVLQAENVTDTGTAIIAGSTVFGSTSANTHKFTGSVQITGSLDISNTDSNITIGSLSQNDSTGIFDIVVRNSADGKLYKAGSNVASAISGAFDGLSASFASQIDSIDTTTTTTNSTDVSNLQTVSASLVESASAGIRFQIDNDNGNSVGLGSTASFDAEGNGFTVSEAGNTITYTLDPTALGVAIGAFSESVQLQTVLDDFYVELSDNAISGSDQLVALGFKTGSNFNQLVDPPTGLLSGAAATATQGIITVNNQNLTLSELGTSGNPVFNDVTVSTLTITGDSTALQVEELTIEDQFMLINSGALPQGGQSANENDRDGGIIVDGGNGSGAVFMYDFGAKAWGFVGADGNNLVSHDATSGGGGVVSPDVYVGTVSSSADNPTLDPAYGVEATTAKGQMHINSNDSTIWIYV